MLKLSLALADSRFDPQMIQSYVKEYNERVDEVPEILKSLLGSEKVNIKIMRDNGKALMVGYATKHAKITRVVEGGLNNPSIVVLATESALKRIECSSDRVSTFHEERASGRVAIKGLNLITRIKLDAALSNTNVLRFFGDFFFA